MKRGDIWTVAGGKDYAGKPRPVVIVQDDSFDATDSITICAFTTDHTRIVGIPSGSRSIWPCLSSQQTTGAAVAVSPEKTPILAFRPNG